jgi:hypothetical protein
MFPLNKETSDCSQNRVQTQRLNPILMKNNPVNEKNEEP